jgi:hypothetical protein
MVTWPLAMVRAAIELPRTMERSIREANDLMEISREQLEVMRRQADQALEQAERMNELLSRVVRLTEPLEKAQRGGEYVGERLKRAIFGEEARAEQAVERAEGAAGDAEGAALHAETAAEDAERAAEHAEEAERLAEGEPPVAPDAEGGVEIGDPATIRVIPDRGAAGKPEAGGG